MSTAIESSFTVPAGGGCQLAEDYSGIGCTWPLIVERKLDGTRAVTFVSGGAATAYTRNRKPLARLQPWADLLARFDGYVFDGEAWAGSWGATHSFLQGGKTTPSSAVVYLLFDVVPLADYLRGQCAIPQTERKAMLAEFVARVNDPRIRAFEWRLVESHDAMMAAYAAFLDDGDEGAMLKDPAAGYVRGRNAAWTKVKPTHTIDARVVVCREGEGKHAGRLGAFECVTDGGVSFRVGSGLTDAQREQAWRDRDAMIGTYVEVVAQADAATVAEVRFPRFMRFRFDR